MFKRHLITAALFAIGVAAPEIASGSCRAPQLNDGTYVNVDEDTRSITRMTLEFRCAPSRTSHGGGTIRHGGDPHFRLRLWGACSPSDCDWGTSKARAQGQGGPYLAHYDHDFAERRVEIQPLGNQRVRLVVSSTYDDGRDDRSSTDILALKQVSWEPNTNRPGSDYRNFTLQEDQPGLCARQCEGEPRCEAFTYVKPGIQGEEARCWLKEAVPQPVANNCCVSGTK